MYCTIIIIAALHHNASIKALSGVTRSQNLHHRIIYSSWTTPTHHHLPAIIPSVCVCKRRSVFLCYVWVKGDI